MPSGEVLTSKSKKSLRFVSAFSHANRTKKRTISSLRRGLLVFFVIMSLTVFPIAGPAYQGLSVLADTGATVSRVEMSRVSSWLKHLFSKKRSQDAAVERIGQVAAIGSITPRKTVGHVGQTVPFSAAPVDFSTRAVQGVRLSFASSDTSKLVIDETGTAACLQPGLVWVTVTAGNASGRAPVLILPGAASVQTDEEWDAEQAMLNPDGTVSSTTTGSLLDKLSPTVYAQSGGGDSADAAFDALWSSPGNLIGHPANRISDSTHIGTVLPESSNFNVAIPILNLPGRGVPLDLTLYYNSRLWSRNGGNVVFNAVNTWPAPGFSISFGRIVTYASGANTSFVLADPDGSLHYLGTGPGGTNATYQSNDGSHITYVGNATSGGTIYYNSGRYMTVNLVNNRLLVTKIGDSNGNYITISYATQTTPSCNGIGFVWRTAINYITDTLGRIVQFNYDTCNNLTSITAPGIGGTPSAPVTVTLADFDYTTASVSNSFSGLTVQNRPSLGVINAIQHIYFPTPQTGYIFTYSAYGMAYNVSKRVGMSINGSGVIADGTEVAHATFNYPTTASSLTDAPSFTQRTESPGSTNAFVYSTLSPNTMGPNTLTYVVTPPDASTHSSYPVTYLTRSTDSASVSNGLEVQHEIKNYSGTSFQKAVTDYANDPGGQPQVQAVTTYDDTGTPVKTDYSYDSYGNLTQQQDYGFQISGSWSVRRKTVNTYKTDTSYVNAYLRNLLTETDVYDQLNGGVQMSKTTYAYDNYAAMGNMENYGGNYSGGSAPPGYNTSYNNQSLTVRGNPTGITYYSDIANGVSETFNSKRDIFSNICQQQVSCCNLDTYTFSATTYWSSPDSTIQGDPNGVHLTKVLTHDFDTSLLTQSTDPNNLSTSFGYDNSGRPTVTTHPTGATDSTTYNDAAISTTGTSAYASGGVPVSVSNGSVSDGWGNVIQTVNPSGGYVNKAYDPLGRLLSQTNPFPHNGNPGNSTTYLYDPLGRVTVVTLPDGATIKSEWSGSTDTLTDEVGRKIERAKDGLGRLVTVTEQDSTGALNVLTNYTYDIMDDLTQVSQGGMIRAFKYDGLRRRIYESHPEESATINDGSGTMWTAKYTYTSFGKLLTRQDARGVVTTYGYDVLYRLVSISYDTAQSPGVAPTNDVTFTYDTSSSSSTKGLLLGVSMAGSLPTYTESIGYDNFDRISSRSWNMDGQNYPVSYQNDGAGIASQLTYPSGRVINKNVDNIGRLSSLTEPSQTSPTPTYLSSVTYDVGGRVTKDTQGSGVVETYTYDANRLQATSVAASSQGGTNLLSENYSYQASAGQMGTGTTAGNAGQLVAVTNGSVNGNAETASYTYDLEGRLTTYSQTLNSTGTSSGQFVYDAFGNRIGLKDSNGVLLQGITMQQIGGMPTNRIQTVTNGQGTQLSYGYDSAGNITSDGVHTYQWDAENRLVSVDGGATASYVYDYRNKRIKKAVGGSLTHYVWDGDRVLAESPSGGQNVDYVYSDAKLVGEGSGASLGGNGVFTYPIEDRLSPRLSTDKAGNVQGYQGALPYGEDFGESGSQEKHHFTSYERDGETGLDYAENRFYDCKTGRFLSMDPVLFEGFAGSSPGAGCSSVKSFKKAQPQSIDPYTYVEDDPTDRIDPQGLFQLLTCVPVFFPNPSGNPDDPLDGYFAILCVPVFNGETFGVSRACMNLFDTTASECVYHPVSNCNARCTPESINAERPFHHHGPCAAHALVYTIWIEKNGRTTCAGSKAAFQTQCLGCADYSF